MSAPVLGIDPGHDGAAVLLEGTGDPIVSWTWRRYRRKSGDVYALTSELAVGGIVRAELRFLPSVAISIRDDVRQAQLRPHLAVEGLFVHRKAAPSAAIELGRTVGWLTAALLPICASYHDSAIAGEWRPAVLDCPRTTSSDDAERLALLRWGARWRGELATDPHVAEADAIAWYRRVGLQREAQLAGSGRH